MKENIVFAIIGLIAIVFIVFNIVEIIKKKSSKHKTVSITSPDDQLVARSNLSKFAGAIDSIKFRGVEYVNSFDHGRLFQTAMQIDGYGECYNPTEAGCSLDAKKEKSSSIITGQNVTQNKISTSVKAASWAVKPTGHNFCPLGPYPGFKGPVSNTVIYKNVTANNGELFWEVTVDTDAKETMNVEFLTGYMPKAFSRMFCVKPKLQEINSWDNLSASGVGYPDGSTQSASNYNKQSPVILSTEDGSSAIGIVRVGPVSKTEAFETHLFKFNTGNNVNSSGSTDACVKFSLVSSGPVKTLGYKRAYGIRLLFGTLDEVIKNIK